MGVFLDLRQVEVLKEPQGSAFGRNAMGDSINLITAKPEDGFSGEINAGIGTYGRRKVGGFLNFGGDTFGIRVSGLVDQDDGFVKNNVAGNDDLNDKDNTLARIALAWMPSSGVTLDYSLSFNNAQANAPAQGYTNATAAAAAAELGGLLGLTPIATPATEVNDDRYVVVNRFDLRTERESTLHVLNAEYDKYAAVDPATTSLVDFSGAQLSRSLEFTGVLGANFHHNLSDNVEFTVRAESFVTSEISLSQLAQARQPGALDQKGYELFNLTVTVTIDDNIDVRLYGKNLSDGYYQSTMTGGTAGFQYGGFG